LPLIGPAAPPLFNKNILATEPGQRCVIMGTLYKDMKLKPNILDEYHAREVRVTMQLLAS